MFSPAATAPIYCPLSHDYHDKEYVQDGDNIQDIKHCTETPVTSNFLQVCHGQKRCNLTASPVMLQASVCSDHFVYLKTVFACVDMRVIEDEYVDRKNNQITERLQVTSTSRPIIVLNEEESKISHVSHEISVTKGEANKESTQVSPMNGQINVQQSFILPSFGNIIPSIFPEENLVTPSTFLSKNLNTRGSINIISDEDKEKTKESLNSDILNSIATREWTILSDNINLDILPLEQDPNTVPDKNENFSEYIEKHQVVIGMVLVIILTIVFFVILIILAIPAIQSCKQQQYTNNNNNTQTKKQSQLLPYFVQLSDDQPSPCLLPEPELFTREPRGTLERENTENKNKNKFIRSQKNKCITGVRNKRVQDKNSENTVFNSWNFG